MRVLENKLLLSILILAGGISIGSSYALVNIAPADDASVDSTKKIFFDGGVSTYITSPSASIMDFVVGDSIAMRSEKSGGVVKTIMPSTNRLYLDGGATTYIFSPTASIMDFVVGDSISLRSEFSGGVIKMIIPQTNKLFFDGGANSYIQSPGFATIDIFSGNKKTLTANNGLVGIGTGTPLEKLDVAGNIRLTGNIVSPTDICIGTCP